MLTQTYIDFFEDLAQNNHREWFQANKQRYEEEAKAPFLSMIQQVLEALNKEDRGYPEEAKTTLFRIHRDVRFAKDKTPYHTILKTSIVKTNGVGEAKKSAWPGIYLAADAHTLRIGGGLVKIEPKKLKLLRQYVADHIEELQQMVSANAFANTYQELLKGESYKKPDAIAQSAEVESPYLLLKQFYYMQEYPIKDYLNQDLTNFILHHIQAAKPVHQFLTDAMSYTQQTQQA